MSSTSQHRHVRTALTDIHVRTAFTAQHVRTALTAHTCEDRTHSTYMCGQHSGVTAENKAESGYSHTRGDERKPFSIPSVLSRGF